jgi:tRNA A37 threonylcarbamoyladenosine dehydratase
MTTPDWQSRTELLLGKEALLKLKNSNVLVLGLGGVGAYTTELLCRAGVGRLTIADGDTVQPSNINRQLIALESTLGREKAEVLAERLREINPLIELRAINEFLRLEKMDEVLETQYDFVVDAIDTLSPKVFLIFKTLGKGYPIVSSMGAGGKLDPSQVKVSDISESYNCRLAHSLRKKLHRLGIHGGFKVVFSPETVSRDSVKLIDNERNKRSTVGTISYMPPLFGCVMASVVIRELIRKESKRDKSGI